MQRCCCRCDGSAAEVDQLYQWAAACVRVKSPRFEIVAVLHDQYSVLDIRWMGLCRKKKLSTSAYVEESEHF